MFSFKFVFLLVVQINFSLQIENSEIFCSKQFCETYKIKNKCNAVPLACSVQNATFNGIFLPFPGPCNCCDYCLTNLNLNDKCVIGSAGSLTPKTICGDGLQCKKDDQGKDSVCKPIDSELCSKKLQDWNKREKLGLLGHMELPPQCDRKGKYKPVVCIPGEICFCVSEDGKRIFGEVPYNPQAQIFMKCGCSRSINKANIILNEDTYSLKRAHCLSDGSFDGLQCVNKTCVCVDSEDGRPADSTSYINIKLISKDNLACFDEDIHEVGQYLRSCEKEYKKVLSEVELNEESGIVMLGVKFPNCQLDGRYAAVQENENDKYCADTNGNILKGTDNQEYKINKHHNLAKTMNCKCARASSIIVGKEKPVCCKNGNFQEVQCRRGFCRCVDSDGLQTIKEVDMKDIKTLKCNQKENEFSCTVDL